MKKSATELRRDRDDHINDTELVHIQSEHLGSASSQPLPDSPSNVTEKVSIPKKRGEERLAAVCAVSPGTPRKRRRPGLGRSPMERFWRTHLAVTQLCAQTWCELQVAYGFEIPHVPTRLDLRPEVKAGAEIHLSRELEVQRVVSVPVLTREDRQAVSFLNLLSIIPDLQAGLRVRELPVFGLLEGVFLVGVIDELHFSERGELVLSELKTRSLNTLPGPAQVKGHNLQVRLYKLLFDSLVRGDLQRDHVITHLRLRPQRALGKGVLEHAGKLSLPVSTFGDLLDLLILNLRHCELPAVDRLSLEYCHQGTGTPIGTQDVTFAEPQLRAELRYYLSYWTGHREPRGVDIEEVWKCQSCPYQQHCEWKQEESTPTVTTPTKENMTDHTLPHDTGHVQRDTDHTLPQDTGHAQQDTDHTLAQDTGHAQQDTDHTLAQDTGHALQDTDHTLPLDTGHAQHDTDHTLPQDTGHAQQDTDTESVTLRDTLSQSRNTD